MIAGVLMVKAFYRGEKVAQNNKPAVTLGALEYEFKDGKATKKNTPQTTSLRAFLEKRAAEDCTGQSFEPSQYTVVAANKEVSQVLLGYGCGDVSARMFAVQKNNEWEFISPTNHFDVLTNQPECVYVNKNAIDREIAPVCYTVKGDAVNYQVR